MVTNGSGNTSSNLAYFLYGSHRASSGTMPTERKFTGQRLDGTELYYYGARYYDAGLGRFVSGDGLVPGMANPQAWNRYSYVVNNPLRYVDPTGRWHRPSEEALVAFIDSPDPALPTRREIELYEVIKREHGLFAKANRLLTEQSLASLPQSAAIGAALIGAKDVDLAKARDLLSALQPGTTILTDEGAAIGLKSLGRITAEIEVVLPSGATIPTTIRNDPTWPGRDATVYLPGEISVRNLQSMLPVWMLVHEAKHVEQRHVLGGTLQYLLWYALNNTTAERAAGSTYRGFYVVFLR